MTVTENTLTNLDEDIKNLDKETREYVEKTLQKIEDNGHFIFQTMCNSGEIWTIVGEEEGYIIDPPHYFFDVLAEYHSWLEEQT